MSRTLPRSQRQLGVVGLARSVGWVACLVVAVQARLRESVQALGGHHAAHRAHRRVHIPQLRQEQRRPQEANLDSNTLTLVLRRRASSRPRWNERTPTLFLHQQGTMRDRRDAPSA